MMATGVSCLVISLHSNLVRAVGENTTFVISMIELGAVRADATAHPKKEFSGNQHAERRRREIDPKGMPVATSKC